VGWGDHLTRVPELLGPMLQLASVWRSRAWGLAGNSLAGLVALVLAEPLIIPRNWITVLITMGMVVILTTAMYLRLREATRNERVIDRCAHAPRQIAASRLKRR
jgi:peptidoglycan/LPS O-acetylase OafA/YrhL